MDSIFYIFAGVFGLIIGSFLNCLAWRLHTKESLNGRSHCRDCSKMIAWYDNIPLLSFLLLRGRCRHCQAKISWQYPIVEALTGLLFFLAALNHPFNYLILARDWFFISVFIVIFIMDARWYIIQDRVSLPPVIVALAFNLALGFSWLNLLISATIGTGFFLAQFLISRGRWIGGGDIRLGLLLGVCLGWPYIMAAIFLGYCFGAIVGVALLASKRKKWGSMLPLGTFLSAAAIIILLYGEPIVNWYLQLINWR